MPENRPRDEIIGTAEDADADGFAFEVGDLFEARLRDQVHLRFEHRVDADQRRAGDRRPQGAAHGGGIIDVAAHQSFGGDARRHIDHLHVEVRFLEKSLSTAPREGHLGDGSARIANDHVAGLRRSRPSKKKKSCDDDNCFQRNLHEASKVFVQNGSLSTRGSRSALERALFLELSDNPIID